MPCREPEMMKKPGADRHVSLRLCNGFIQLIDRHNRVFWFCYSALPGCFHSLLTVLYSSHFRTCRIYASQKYQSWIPSPSS